MNGNFGTTLYPIKHRLQSNKALKQTDIEISSNERKLNINAVQ